MIERKPFPGKAINFLRDVHEGREPLRSVLVEGDGKRRHLRLHCDEVGYYVRVGKRGTVKEYITSARFVANILWIFGYGSKES
jgi:hypothetical protein